MNNGSFLVQLTGKLIFAYVKSLVTVILLVPHCRLIHQQWGSCGNIVYHGEEVISVNFKLPVTLTTFFGGITTHNYSGETTNGIYLARISKTAGSTNVSEFDVHYKDMLTHYYYGPMFVVVIGK
nr:MAG: hypothetical protein [Bacteriophage sp.]